MNILWTLLVIVVLCGMLAQLYSRKYVYTNGTIEYKPSKFFSFLAAASLVIVSGLRAGFGDTGTYRAWYNMVGTDWSVAFSRSDWGFYAFNVLLNYISRDSQLLVFISALIVNVCVVVVLYKYSERLSFSFFMYITCGYFAVSMNGIRQVIVATVMFLCFKLLIADKWKTYFLIVLIMSTFHASVLILIPIYFLVRKPAFDKKLVMMLLLSGIALIFIESLIPILFVFLKYTSYAIYEDMVSAGLGGANIIRVLVGAVPVVLAFLARKKLYHNNKMIIYCINFSIVNLIFIIFALQSWIFARFTLYFSLYNLILLPHIINLLFSKKARRLVYFTAYILYFIYFYYQMVITWNVNFRFYFM